MRDLVSVRGCGRGELCRPDYSHSICMLNERGEVERGRTSCKIETVRSIRILFPYSRVDSV